MSTDESRAAKRYIGLRVISVEERVKKGSEWTVMRDSRRG